VDTWAQIFLIEGQTPPNLQELPTTRFGLTDDRYLKTMHIPLVRGRDFNASDSESREPVALISEEFVSRYFGDRDPIGVRIHLGQPEDRTVSAPPNPIAPGYVTVVGVIGNFRNNGLAFPPEPQLIVLFRQEPSVNFGFKDVVVRTLSDPRSITRSLRQQLHEMDPNLPLAEVQTIQEHISVQTSNQRFLTSLLSIFASLGLTLAVVGVYGVISFLVVQRTQELGIRLALGAKPSNILWLVLRQAITMGAVGVAVGLFGAAAARKLLAQLLFQVSATNDVVTLATVSVALLAIAAIASAVPGVRAMRIDAASALRQE
jgi:putative ABC transport system permease protein